MLLQKKANGGKERSFDTFIAGLIGGYVVFGKRTAINEQVRASVHRARVIYDRLIHGAF